jgi:hypothetical protein
MSHTQPHTHFVMRSNGDVSEVIGVLTHIGDKHVLVPAAAISLLHTGDDCAMQEGCRDVILLPNVERVGDAQSADVININSRGIILFLNIVSIAPDASLQIRTDLKDPISGGYAPAGLSKKVDQVGLYTYARYPAALEGFNDSIVSTLPSRFRVVVQHDGGPVTYSLAGVLLP